MTPEILVRHVEDSIVKAILHESVLDKEILDIKGFSTATMRRLFSNLCHLPKVFPIYCEVGLHCGSSFCAAINNNPNLTAIGYEDFSQHFDYSNVEAELDANIKATKERGAATIVFKKDFFQAKIPLDNIDIFYYDGNHNYEFQRAALPYAFGNLAPLFLYIVDDYSWHSVKTGTQDSMEELKDKMKVEKEWTLTGERPNDDTIWHNGLYIAACSKL